MGALYKGVIATVILSLIGLWPLTDWLIGMDTALIVSGAATYTGMTLFWCGVVGLAVTGALIVITEYYTGTNFRPVQSIAKSSVTGHGTNVIQGLAISMEATALPALVICAGIVITYTLAGLFGIAIARQHHAVAGGHGGGAGCFRSGHRQCRRHCRNERAWKAMCARPPTRWTRWATPPRR